MLYYTVKTLLHHKKGHFAVQIICLLLNSTLFLKHGVLKVEIKQFYNIGYSQNELLHALISPPTHEWSLGFFFFADLRANSHLSEIDFPKKATRPGHQQNKAKTIDLRPPNLGRFVPRPSPEDPTPITGRPHSPGSLRKPGKPGKSREAGKSLGNLLFPRSLFRPF